MVELPLESLRQVANEDPEFRLAGRYWDCNLEIAAGERRTCLRIFDGEIVEVVPWSDERANAFASTITISAAEEEWRRLLEAVPRPFYHDLWAATVYHGFEVSGDFMAYCAYYRATSRLLELLRRLGAN